MQSNREIMTNPSLELVVQLVQNPRGGAKRKLEKNLDVEIFAKNKKSHHLYLIGDRWDQLCFAISVTHLLHPTFTDSQAAQYRKELQRRAGLNDQTPVTFSDVHKFENIVKRKIVV